MNRISTIFLSLSLIMCLLLPSIASADVYVKGYTRKDGTYVSPHYRSDPDSSKLNNWSTVGNTNPYTGKEGTIDPYAESPTYNSSAPSYNSIYAPSSSNSFDESRNLSDDYDDSYSTNSLNSYSENFFEDVNNGFVLGESDETSEAVTTRISEPLVQLPQVEPLETTPNNNDDSAIAFLGLMLVGGGIIASIFSSKNNKNS